MGLIDTAIQTGLGLALENHNDKRQVKQQQKLTDMQKNAQMDIGKFNQGLALDTWEKTNYGAQRQQMEKAGLNIGLMYGSAGQGGTTQGGSAGGVSGGNAQGQAGEVGLAIQLGLQKEMQKAQIELARSQAQKTQAETAKLQGADTAKTTAETQQIGANIEAIKQQIKNAKAQETLTNYQSEIAKIETQIKTETQHDIAQAIRNANSKAEQEIQALTNTNEITEQTKEQVINQINTASIEQGLRIAGQKAGLNLTEQQAKKVAAEIGKIANDTLNNWRGLDQAQQKIEIDKILMNLRTQETDFKTSTPEQVRQWTSILTDFIPLAGKKK